MSSPVSNSSSEGTVPPSRGFERLHERVRRWVWQQNWEQLRDVQEAAIEPILEGKTDIIIMAATAGGKTEAAFLPICSMLVGNAAGGVRALYISPLKALINDQFERLDALCEHLEIPVHRWHGDVGATKKQALIRNPSGILLITPESMEALFVIHGTQIGRVFSRLDHVVVDELHSFIGNERGRQLQSLLHRLEHVLGRSVPRIALSATLGDAGAAAEFLRPQGGDRVLLIQSAEGGQELRLQVRGYRTTAPVLTKEQIRTAERDGQKVEVEERVTGDESAVSDHLFTTLRGSDNLIFANARSRAEEYADLLRRMSEREHVPNEFFPHHGNLSKELREEVEAVLKDKTRPLSAVCTSTLELGIDIGTVKSIAQIGAPPSVASMRQRLGRSGRRGEPAILRIYVSEPEVTGDTPPQDTLHAELVQTIAMVNLLIAGWYEPPLVGALHLSALVQQILSIIAQNGGVMAREAWALLCKTGPFSEVDASMFATLLRSLGDHDLIAQARDGTLVHGGLGERIVNHYSFYTAFTTPEEYRLVTDGQTLGTLPISYPLSEGAFLIFAGQRWKVTAVDPAHKVVDLVPAPGGRPPIFFGTGASVHDCIRQEMFNVYCSGDLPTFLDSTARDLLIEARANFARLGLVEKHVIAYGKDTLLFCWVGDRVMNTIVLQLRAKDLRVSQEGLAITGTNCGPNDLRDVLAALVAEGPADARQLATTVADKLGEKYDRFLPEELLIVDYASRHLDSIRAWDTLKQLGG